MEPNQQNTSKQNITRDIEIKNNLTVTRGEGIMGGKGKWFSGTSLKDTWAKPMRGGSRGGREGGIPGVGGSSRG